MSRRNQKQKQRKQQKRKKRQTARRSASRQETGLDPLDLRVRHTELAHPPVYVDSSGARIADPFVCLGLDPQLAPTRDAVQAAFQAALAETPPESDPQRARELREARDFLLEPGEALTRTLGDLRVPNPEHFLPGYQSRKAPATTPTSTTDWSSRTRLVAIMTLFALLAEELEGGAPPPMETGNLFD